MNQHVLVFGWLKSKKQAEEDKHVHAKRKRAAMERKNLSGVNSLCGRYFSANGPLQQPFFLQVCRAREIAAIARSWSRQMEGTARPSNRRSPSVKGAMQRGPPIEERSKERRLRGPMEGSSSETKSIVSCVKLRKMRKTGYGERVPRWNRNMYTKAMTNRPKMTEPFLSGHAMHSPADSV